MPTAKRQKYLDRLNAKQTNNRTQEERQAEYDKFMSQFANLGLGTEFEEIAKFDTMAKEWVTNGTPYQGAIPLNGMKRDLVYSLTNNKKHNLVVMLKSTEDAQQSGPVNQNNANPAHKKQLMKKVPLKPPQAQSA